MFHLLNLFSSERGVQNIPTSFFINEFLLYFFLELTKSNEKKKTKIMRIVISKVEKVFDRNDSIDFEGVEFENLIEGDDVLLYGYYTTDRAGENISPAPFISYSIFLLFAHGTRQIYGSLFLLEFAYLRRVCIV